MVDKLPFPQLVSHLARFLPSTVGGNLVVNLTFHQLLKASEHLKIIDFGFAKCLGTAVRGKGVGQEQALFAKRKR